MSVRQRTEQFPNRAVNRADSINHCAQSKHNRLIILRRGASTEPRNGGCAVIRRTNYERNWTSQECGRSVPRCLCLFLTSARRSSHLPNQLNLSPPRESCVSGPVPVPQTTDPTAVISTLLRQGDRTDHAAAINAHLYLLFTQGSLLDVFIVKLTYFIVLKLWLLFHNNYDR